MHIGHWRSLTVETKPIAFTLPTSGWAFTDIGGTGVSGRVGVAVPLPSRRAGASTRPPANHGISLIFCPPGRGPCPSAYAPLIWPNPTTRENDAQGSKPLQNSSRHTTRKMDNDSPHCNPQRRSSVEYRIHGGRAHYQIMTAHRRSHGAVARHHGRSRRASHSDADLLGALILKSATYQADHAGLEIDICTMPQCSHPSSPTLMPKLGDYIATRIADVSSSRTTCSPMNHLTGTTLTNNIAEQDSMP